MEYTKSLLTFLLLSLSCLAVRGEFILASLQEFFFFFLSSAGMQLLHAQRKFNGSCIYTFCTCAHAMLSAGAPPVEPELSHVPDISGGIGGPTDVNVQPANVSLPRALPNRFSMVVRQFAILGTKRLIYRTRARIAALCIMQ